jgi:hypothetical protein
MAKTPWGKAPFTIKKSDGTETRAIVSGRELWALECLMAAGPMGSTPIDHPGPRWSAYVFDLREMGVEIETVTEPHGAPFAGSHTRYVLKAPVERMAGASHERPSPCPPVPSLWPVWPGGRNPCRPRLWRRHRMSATPVQIALDLARAGFPVFPCKKDKTPYTGHGFKDAALDPATVAAFWQAQPSALIGVPTGQASGLYVVDLDTDKATGEALGEATLAALGLSHLLNGPRVDTPSGGRHLYFRADGLAEGLGCTAKKIGPGIDRRGEGGYVIAPGSVAPAGAYVALLAALQGKPKPEAGAFQFDTGAGQGWAEAALAGELGRVMAAQEGARNDTLNRAAFRLAQIVAWGALSEDTVKARLLGAALAIGLDEAEARKTIASGYAAGMAEPRGPKPTDEGTANNGKPGAEDWQQPEARFLRPELPAPPALPLAEVFGPIWAAWIAKAAEAKAAPADYVVAGLLSVVGATIGNTRWASPWAGWAEPPIIWAMAIGTPSMNKSPGFDAVLSPLRKLEREARKRVEAEVSDWKERAEVSKVADSAWKESVKAAMKDGKDIPAKPTCASPGPEPIRPRYAMTDATVERVLSRREAAGYSQTSAPAVNVTIMARDAESFRQSRTQVASDIAIALQGGQHLRDDLRCLQDAPHLGHNGRRYTPPECFPGKPTSSRPGT